MAERLEHACRAGVTLLRRHLRSVRKFLLAYNLPIYAGEWSALPCAPGPSDLEYHRDSVDVFERYGRDWSCHAYREWDGWSVEHGLGRENGRPAT